MNKYKTLINNLIKQQSPDLDGDQYYISIYIPFDYGNMEKVSTEVKSYLLKSLREHPGLKNETKFHTVLLDAVQEYLELAPVEGKGLAMFIGAKISEVLKGQDWNIDPSNISVIPIYVEIEHEICIDKIYCLDQLIRADNKDNSTLVINLNEEESIIYLFEEGDLENIDSIEKRNWVLGKPKFFARASGDGATVYGKGSDKHQRFEMDIMNKFVKRIQEQIRDIYSSEKLEVYNTLIYYSQPFTPFIEDIKQYIQEISQSSVHTFSKSISDEAKLMSDVKQSLKELKRDRSRDRYLSAKEDYHNFVQGYKEVTDASRARKIETLFVKRTNPKRGYLFNMNLIYTYPVKDSRLVKNIHPWLVRDVIANGGDVIILNDKKEYPNISALLRF